MFRLALWLIPSTALFLVLSGCGKTEEKASPVRKQNPVSSEYGAGHARPHLMTEVAAMAPGKPDTLGIRFDIEPGWHLFWNGLNDTGYPIEIRPNFPPGFEVGEILWPAPERHESPGDIVDHVYFDSVTLLLPFRAPKDLETGSWVTLTCGIQWLSCREACVPGQDELSITLPVIDPEGSDRDRSLWQGAVKARPAVIRDAFEAARARIPRMPGPLEVTMLTRWEGKDLVIEVPGAVELAFFPETGSAPMESILRDGVSQGETLRLRLAPDPGEATAVLGVLEISDGAPGNELYYSIQFPLEKT